MISDNTKNEQHPHLPSGEWEGFYCYSNSKEQHKMSTDLTFIQSSVRGSGVDDIAPFTWSGKYDLNTNKLTTRKIYTSHQFVYKGDIDENGIWGTWESVIEANKYPRIIRMTGGFHIWPKQKGYNQNAESVDHASKILEELFLEEFA